MQKEVFPFLQVEGERHHWDAVWVKAEEVIREGILASPNMATDHYAMTLQVNPFVLEEAIKKVPCMFHLSFSSFKQDFRPMP